ncbi:MAG: hypothetical protein WC989_06490 [Micavibrio sp.]
MSGSVKLWCFILLLPFFAAVGHDFYANFLATHEQKTRLEAFEIDPKAYQGSDFGYILVKYAPNQFYAVREVVPKSFWEKWIEPVLHLYSFVVALFPAFLYFIWLLFCRIFDRGPFAGAGPSIGRGGRSSDMALRPKNEAMQFKRK